MNKIVANTTTIKLYGMLFLAVFLNLAVWYQVRPIKIEWKDVPPVPSVTGALWSTLGDRQFAYRGYGIMVQNMGDTGGTTTNVANYDKEKLKNWFMLMHKLDPEASHIPYLAGYFYAAQRKQEDELGPIIDYLEVAAGKGEKAKWRFMAQAILLARFKMNDLDRALELANKLARFENPDMPPWARQMPAFILTAQGEKEAARAVMLNLLKTEADTLHPNEVNETIRYVCTRTFTAAEASQNPLCKDIEL